MNFVHLECYYGNTKKNSNLSTQMLAWISFIDNFEDSDKGDRKPFTIAAKQYIC